MSEVEYLNSVQRTLDQKVHRDLYQGGVQYLGEGGYFGEKTPQTPNSPYSATKASSDLMALAYHNTFKLPMNITRCSNNYGPYKFPEKLIPLMISNALEDKPLPIYGDGLHVRDWLHVHDHCTAIDLVLHQGQDGEVYNIGGNNEKQNIKIVHLSQRIWINQITDNQCRRLEKP